MSGELVIRHVDGMTFAELGFTRVRVYGWQYMSGTMFSRCMAIYNMVIADGSHDIVFNSRNRLEYVLSEDEHEAKFLGLNMAEYRRMVGGYGL
jgi:hypothetical protein